MNWTKGGACFLESSDPVGYHIARANIGDGMVAYSAIRLGTPDRETWVDSKILDTFACLATDDPVRRNVIERMKLCCEADATESA